MLQDENCSEQVLAAIKNKWWPDNIVVDYMPKYWIMAPGQNAILWEQWQAEGIANIGWFEAGDLSEYVSQAELEKHAESKAAARMLWLFCKVMKPGDVVFAKRGRSKICGWGIVTGDYKYDEEQNPHPSSRTIDWRETTEYPMPPSMTLPMQTLTPMDSNLPFLCEMKGAYERVPGLDTIDCADDETEDEEIELIAETDFAEATEGLIQAIAAKGFTFQPWHIATYVTAMRTKPFVILAGVSGTGKSKLPALIAELTTGKIDRVSVRPDWTDSSDVLGYVDLQDRFRAGVVLAAARIASTDTERFHVCLLDEMNLARVEHYFAEVLSAIEDRRRVPTGGYESTKLIAQTLPTEYRQWQEQTMPANFGIVGTVNMDESSHGFSRKVLDRAFTLELSEVDLDLDQSTSTSEPASSVYWPPAFWYCRATRIAECDQATSQFREAAERATEVLKSVNQCLVYSQLQVGYRTRDEVILFLMNAQELKASFRTRGGASVDPLDLALMMKVLPRLVGGSNAIRRTMIGLLGLAHGKPMTESEVEAAVASWATADRPDAIAEATFPRTAARLCLMWERLISEGYTSFWL
ncbi:MAG: AAA family ATPase [Pirellulaceae bacterium]